MAMITSNLAQQAHGELRLLLGVHNIGRSLWMTVWPWPIAPNHGYEAVELQLGFSLPTQPSEVCCSSWASSAVSG